MQLKKIGIGGFLIFAAVYETLARKSGGVSGWRKTLLTAFSSLIPAMIGELFRFFVINK